MAEPLVARAAWRSLDRPGCVGVEVSGVAGGSGMAVTMLRFGPGATIDEHDAPFDIDVLCLDGAGWASMGERTFQLSPEVRLRWPAGTPHQLWTDASAMTTLMIEHRGAATG